MDKASDEGCHRARIKYNEGLSAGDTGYTDRYEMVAEEQRGRICLRKKSKDLL